MLEQSFISYITDFAKNAPDSQSVPWYDNYFKTLNKAPYKEEDFRSIKNKDFNNVWSKLERTLTRNDLFKFFIEGSDESLYKGYVATMLWGGIGTGGGSKDNLINAMSQPKSEIIDRIKEIKKVLGSGKENEVKAAFIMMTKKYGTNFNFEGKEYSGAKIPGIDISYFTKLLFFLGNKDWECQPLVYDNQLQNVHCALLKDSGIGVQSLFDIHSFKMDSSTISCRISLRNGDLAKPVDFYIDFIKRVKSLSESIELSGDNEFQGKAGRLEEIMFGKELSRKRIDNDPRTNPRAFVKNYLGLTEYDDDQNDQNDREGEISTTNEMPSSKIKPKNDRNITIHDPYDVLTVKAHKLELYVGENKNGYLCKYRFMEASVDKHEVFKDSSVLSILNGAQRTKKNYDYSYCKTIEEARRLFEQVKAEILRLQQE